MWRDNPDADYSNIVDTPRVYEFIDSFRGSGEVWTFPFTTASDIVRTLRQQFAYLVQDALALRRMAHDYDRLLEELEGDALMLALQQGENWGMKLFGTVLEAELDRRAPLRREVEHGLTRGDVSYIGVDKFSTWGQNRIREFRGLAQTAEAVINEYLPQALRDEGVPADALELVAAAPSARPGLGRPASSGRCSAGPFELTRTQNGSSRRCQTRTRNMRKEIWDFGHSIIPRIDEAIREHAAGGPGVIEMNLTLTADFDEFSEELARVRERACPLEVRAREVVPED